MEHIKLSTFALAGLLEFCNDFIWTDENKLVSFNYKCFEGDGNATWLLACI